MATARPSRVPSAPPHAEVPAPRKRVAALATDLVFGGMASLSATLVAGAWLLVRTGWGRDDVGAGDATFAAALLLAATPAWLAWTALRLARDGATPGQARYRLSVRGGTRQRLTRLACHPTAVPGWCWLAVLAATARMESIAVAGLGVGVVVALGGLVTAARILIHPEARALHDLVAGTRLYTARAS